MDHRAGPPRGGERRDAPPRPTGPRRARPDTDATHPAGGPRAREDLATALETTFGLRACLALASKRPGDVIKLACAPGMEAELAPLRELARDRDLRLTSMSDAELARISGSTHHEGVVIAARPRAWLPVAKLADRLVASKGAAVALDRVRNPYNVGAILRTAAFFGVDAAILGAPAPHPALAPDAVRVAEGGAEQLALARTTDLADTLSRLRARGVRVYGADGAATTSALGVAFERPAVIVMGHEREGLSPRVRAECDQLIAIAGTGAVESLNVAVAAGLLIGELIRGRR